MIQIPVHIQGLIFDLDGTLADTMPIHIQAWQAAGRLYGVEITEAMVMKYAGSPTLEVVPKFNQEFGWDLDPTKVRFHKNEAYYQIKADLGKIRPITKVVNIAEEYRGKLPMAVGTGSTRENALVSLNDLGITDWFEGLVGANDINNPKPAPDTFLRCAEIIQKPPQKCLVFEDGAMGIEAALAAGMEVVDIREV